MSYKLSYYARMVDLTEDRLKKILFSGRTGKTIVISTYFAELLATARFSEIPEKSLAELIAIKALVDPEENELAEIIRENKAVHAIQSTVLYEVIQPTANCQLGCYYCGQAHSKAKLSSSIYKNLIDRIKQKLAKGGYEKLYISWFGAEPLMAIQGMRELTTLFKEVALEHNLSYGAKMVSNGLGLKPRIYDELVTQLNIDSIEVTLDGDATYHDLHRYTKKGTNSFNTIFNNLTSILLNPDYNKQKCGISIRCNVDEKNKDGVVPLINLLARTGLHKKIKYLYTVGVYSWGGNEAQEGAITKEEFAKLQLGWLIAQDRLGFPMNYNFAPHRTKTLCLATSQESDVYDAFGNIFSCTEVSYSPVYQDKYLMNGNLNNPAEINEERPLTKWNDQILNGEFPCTKCKILPVCGGTCPKAWHEGHGACPPVKFNLDEKLRLSHIFNKSSADDKDKHLHQFEEALAPKTLTAIR